MHQNTCCFTGHRVIPKESFMQLQNRLEDVIQNLIQQNILNYYVGGALGFDTLAAQVIIKLRKKYPHIKLILVLPCKEQSKKWSTKDKKIYNDILNQSDWVVYTSDQYFIGCMQLRNRYLVDHSKICICYLEKEKGGTAYTVQYAKKKGLYIFNLAEE